MKIINLNKSIFLIGLVLFTTILLQSCAQKMTFINSNVVPAAEGTVKITTDDNNNYLIEMNIMRLADPKRLDKPKNTYVVWMNTDDNGTKNIGQINTKSSLFSSTLRSSLKTVTTFKPTGFFITAEDDSDVQEAKGQVILKTFGN